MALGLDRFRGLWRIERRIEDRLAGRSGVLQGQARFTDADTGLVYREEGVLRFAGQPDLTARQSYLWREGALGIEVLFADGKPFHGLPRDDAAPCAHHHCSPDDYVGRYDFSAWPEWRVEWHVSGPRKDYTMRTRYSR